MMTRDDVSEVRSTLSPDQERRGQPVPVCELCAVCASALLSVQLSRL